MIDGGIQTELSIKYTHPAYGYHYPVMDALVSMVSRFLTQLVKVPAFPLDLGCGHQLSLLLGRSLKLLRGI